MNLLRQVRLALGIRPASSADRAWSVFRADVSHASLFVPAFYAFCLYLEACNMATWNELRIVPGLIPLWPVFWIKEIGSYPGNVALLQGFSLGASLAGLVLWRLRSVRLLVFLALFLEVALRNSFGKINHNFHLLILLSFLLVLLPKQDAAGKKSSLGLRARLVLILRTCRTVTLLTYSLSGMAKIAFCFIQTFRGEMNSLHPYAMGAHIADRLLETNDVSNSTLGPWLIDHVWIAWPLMLGTIYLQAFSLWAAFRPSLQIPWALGLITFHIMSSLTITIDFPQNCLLLALLFLLHPATLDRFCWRNFLRDLPLFGVATRRFIAAAS
jgi:hypothetical protein